MNENGDGYTGGGAGISTSYQNVQSHLGSNHLNANSKVSLIHNHRNPSYIKNSDESGLPTELSGIYLIINTFLLKPQFIIYNYLLNTTKNNYDDSMAQSHILKTTLILG